MPGGYHFNFDRDIGDVKLIVIDSRNGRVLDPAGARWSTTTVGRGSPTRQEPCRHLVLASSLPMLVPGGLHDLQQWNEAVCAGKWGKTAARSPSASGAPSTSKTGPLRRLVPRAVRPDRRESAVADDDAPDTITLLAGDIHFAYSATQFPRSGPK